MKEIQDHSKIFVMAGEASGDAIAATVIECLKTQHPGIEIYGAGGQKLKAAGQKQCLDLTPDAVMGAAEVILKLPKFFSYFKQIVKEIENTHPDILLLVDYPGFNLRLAKAIRKKSPQIRIIYLISPKAWAWKSGRAKILERNVDLLISIFSFEMDWYRWKCPSLKVEYVGHPMVDELEKIQVPANRDRHILGIFPGSRRREIQHILPPLLDAARRIKERSIINKIFIAAPNELAAEQVRAVIHSQSAKYPTATYDIVTGMSREVAAQSFVGIVKSGTITAECAYLGLPMVVVYKAGLLEAFLMWIFVRVKYFSLVNLIAGREVVRELAQFYVTGPKVAQETLKLINNLKANQECARGLSEVRQKLGTAGAAGRAATLINEVLKKDELALL
ncbi:MAG: lipid-A-disaccharide synthase [Verrucomicrobiota bacterium]|nr:lipid-A-disaccharide synthase [Verrucomicrobiota bacterium]